MPNQGNTPNQTRKHDEHDRLADSDMPKYTSIEITDHNAGRKKSLSTKKTAETEEKISDDIESEVQHTVGKMNKTGYTPVQSTAEIDDSDILVNDMHVFGVAGVAIMHMDPGHNIGDITLEEDAINTGKPSSKGDQDSDSDEEDEDSEIHDLDYGNIHAKDVREDGTYDLLSLDYYGVVHNYIAVGLYYGAMHPLLYPIFINVLGMKSYAAKGGYQVMVVWWTFKMFIGAFSDCFPIYGYRRKYYVLIGWSLAFVMTIATILLGQPHPGDAAWVYLLCFSGINLFYIIGDVAMDGMVIDMAKHEPIEKRGNIQSTIYLVRSLAMAVTATFMAFGFSSPEYGGDFGWGMQLPHFLMFIGGVNLIGLYFYYRGKESNQYTRKPYFTQFKKMYKRMKIGVVSEIVMFSFFVHLITYINNATSMDVEKQWCKTEPWVDGLFGSVLSSLLMALGIYVTRKYFLNTSWRKLLSITIVSMAIITYVPAVLIDLGIVRSQFFYVGAPLINQLINGIFFIVCSFCAVEVAEKGSECTTIALLTQVSNLSIPFASLISANLASLFDLYDANGKLKDDTQTRHHMLTLDTIIFVVQLCALPTLLLLPAQKKNIQDKLIANVKKPLMAKILIAGLIFCFFWSLIGNFLQIFPSTQCLKIVGGKGC